MGTAHEHEQKSTCFHIAEEQVSSGLVTLSMPALLAWRYLGVGVSASSHCIKMKPTQSHNGALPSCAGVAAWPWSLAINIQPDSQHKTQKCQTLSTSGIVLPSPLKTIWGENSCHSLQLDRGLTSKCSHWGWFKFRSSQLFFMSGKKKKKRKSFKAPYRARIWWPWLRAPCDPALAGRRFPQQWESSRWRWGTALHWQWWSKKRVRKKTLKKICIMPKKYKVWLQFIKVDQK